MAGYQLDQRNITLENIEYDFKDLVNIYLKSFNKVNHEIYRKVIKKVKRKKDRQQKAKLIDRIEPMVANLDIENETIISLNKNLKDHQIWLERERLSQIEFKTKKESEQREQVRRKRKEADNQRKEAMILEKQKKELARRYNKSSLEQYPAHNPIFTIDASQIHTIDQRMCLPFLKTGVCKYANMCVNSHTLDSEFSNKKLTTLIFPGMYTNMLLGYEILSVNLESDEVLEYEESDILDHYKDFYDDVCSEMKTFGALKQFIVCSNYEPHLRGNVYVEFEREKHALKAQIALNGRYYAGKPIYCYFTHVKKWNDAICGSFLRKKCTKGKKCNYLHVFKNPYNEFKYATTDQPRQINETRLNENKYKKKKNWSSDEELDKNRKKSRWSSDDEIEKSLNKSKENQNQEKSIHRYEKELRRSRKMKRERYKDYKKDYDRKISTRKIDRR